MNDASYWKEVLGLEPHPDGGYYKETYRSGTWLSKESLPSGFSGPRRSSTAIYFLLDGSGFNHLHRLKADELWHFYTGSSLTVHLIHPDGKYARIHLGPDLDAGQVFQGIIPAGCWFGARVDDPESFALVGCTVSPGFDFADFEMGGRTHLLAQYPQHKTIITSLTRPE